MGGLGSFATFSFLLLRHQDEVVKVDCSGLFLGGGRGGWGGKEILGLLFFLMWEEGWLVCFPVGGSIMFCICLGGGCFSYVKKGGGAMFSGGGTVCGKRGNLGFTCFSEGGGEGFRFKEGRTCFHMGGGWGGYMFFHMGYFSTY